MMMGDESISRIMTRWEGKFNWEKMRQDGTFSQGSDALSQYSATNCLGDRGCSE